MDFNSIVWYDNNSIEDIQAYLKKNAIAIIEDFEQRINICLDEQMMSDLPKRVNYVSGSVLEDGGSRVSTSVTAVPKVIQSLFGSVQYVGEEEKVLDGVNVSLPQINSHRKMYDSFMERAVMPNSTGNSIRRFYLAHQKEKNFLSG